MQKERKSLLMELGYIPVTDDFWRGCGMEYAVGKGYTWAYPAEWTGYPFMPYSEEYLNRQSELQLRYHAWFNSKEDKTRRQ